MRLSIIQASAVLLLTLQYPGLLVMVTTMASTDRPESVTATSGDASREIVRNIIGNNLVDSGTDTCNENNPQNSAESAECVEEHAEEDATEGAQG
jgi:hypothetical protein